MRKFLLFSLLFLLGVATLRAQVTTSTLTGTVKDSGGESLIGATVKATHQPTGTTYGASTRADGRFTIPNMRAGGPYLIEVSYIGYQAQRFPNISLKLGEPYVLNAILATSGTELREVSVTAADPNSVLNAERNGAVTNISRQQLEALPTITRSVNDITRLTPQAGGPNGSVAGGSYRGNNFTVDGANFNNQFGIGQNVPAGGAPISLDALEQISINVTPYDVRQTGFTGAAINAVTRSGTNTFSGTAFFTGRSETEQGDKIGDFTVTKQNYSQRQYGLSLGGPIIKNKLFFFVNGEWSKIVQPGPAKIASTAALPYGAGNTNVARPSVDFMNGVRSYLMSNYNYDPGSYQGYDNKSDNTKLLARLDWNISKNHRFNVRYNQVESQTPFTMSNSTSNSGLSGYSSTDNRTSAQALHFANSNYFQEANLYSVSAELNSSLGKFTNSLRGTWSHQNDPRSSPGSLFPFVDILEGSHVYTSFGYEPFTYGNLRDVETYSINDDVTATFGKHTLTGGIQAEFSTTKNGFQRFATGFYTFASWNDFVNGAAPTNFAITYPLTADGSQAFPSFKFAQYSLYLQDEFSISQRVKVTGGLRIEQPSYPDASEVQTHPLIAGLTFANGEKINTGEMAETKLMFSPRIGFNWDIMGDRSYQLRGGSGVFTGRIPFVWIVSQSSDAGMLQFLETFDAAKIAANGIKFDPNPQAHIPSTKPQAGTSIPSSISAMASDLKFPQTWKSSLAFDAKLPFGLVGTIEGIYQRDINAVYAKNVNLNNPTALGIAGYPDNREVYPSANAQKYVNKLDGQNKPSATGTNGFTAIVMDNKKGGHYWSVTGQLSKQFRKGLSFTAAYTHSDARNYGDQGGDQIANLWSYPYTVGNSNVPTLGYTSNVLPDRVVASVTYRKEFLQNLATSISLFYEGAIQGRYSYYYSADFNRDGQTNDLIYVPKDASEITFVSQTVTKTVNGQSVSTTYTPQQLSDIFFAYIDQDDYLKTRKGKYAERNGAKLPWRNQVDLRFAQDVFKNFGKTKNTLQFTIDVFNFGNFLNKDWGNINFANSPGILAPQNVSAMGGTANTKPTFRLPVVNGDVIRETYGTTQTVSSTYYMQFGLRYRFN